MSGRVIKAQGIVLKRKNTGEADRIVTVFTKEFGKLRIIAKGIRKVSSRRAPHLEVFTHVSCVVHHGKTMDAVSEVTPIAMYAGIRGDLSKISVAYYLCELVDSLVPERQEQDDMYELLVSSLEALENPNTNIYRLSREFTLELLWALGFLPRDQSPSGKELQSFIESITERKLKSTHFARLLIDHAGFKQ